MSSVNDNSLRESLLDASPTMDEDTTLHTYGSEEESLLGPEEAEPQWVTDGKRIFRSYKWTVLICILACIALGVAAAMVPDQSGKQSEQSDLEWSTIQKFAVAGAECDEGYPMGVVFVPAGGEQSIHMSLLEYAAQQQADVEGSFTLLCEQPGITGQSWLTIGVVAVSLVVMIADLPPELVLLAATVALVQLGVITESEAWEGFSNNGVLTVGVLFTVAKGIENTGAVDMVFKKVLGRPTNLEGALFKMLVPVAIFSAFLNNTPVVAIMIPILESWSKRIGQAPGKLMMPLSYASMLGGMSTLIGTSANLIISGLLADKGGVSFTLFEMMPVGGPCVLAGIVYMAFASRWLLPGRQLQDNDDDDKAEHKGGERQYNVVFRVAEESPLLEETLGSCGLLKLKGAQLVSLRRDGHALPLPGHVRGLQLQNAQVSLLGRRRRHRVLVEAVLGQSSPLVGQSFMQARTDKVYDAAVLCVRPWRGNSPANRERGVSVVDAAVEAQECVPRDYVYGVGDSLIMETYPKFAEQYGNAREFLLVRVIDDSMPPRNYTKMDKFRVWFSLFGLVAMVSLSAFVDEVLLLEAAMILSGLMVLTKCMSVAEAFRAINFRVILAIVAAFGMGTAMEKTGVAAWIAENVIVQLAQPLGDFAVLFAVALVTSFMGAIISNNATVILMFPICFNVALQTSMDVKRVLVVLMMAGSSSFLTPISYQTNLMVLQPGNYAFLDYFWFGAPLQLIVMLVAVAMATLIY
ncbi:MAG: hypothetical protein MHM6MM_006767 [Cercozoa sp. M6MM]